MYRKNYVEINLDNIKYNVETIKEVYNDYEYYIGVVKGNAYGHGLGIIKTLIKAGINYLAVSSLEEALEIRKIEKNIPILILEPIHIEELDIAIKNNITITISNYDYFKKMKKIDIKDLKIHLKLNSGMNRLGLDKKEHVHEICLTFEKNIEGIYSHLATLGIIDKTYDKQIEKFKELVSDIDLNRVKIVHLFRSTSLESHPKLEFCNGVRLGIIMYGYNQTFLKPNSFKNKMRLKKYAKIQKKENISITYKENKTELKPAYRLITEVIEIKEINKGDIVGYAGTYKANSKELIAVCPIGYSDGLSTNYQNKKVLINNNKYNIVGVISMGMITIKVDDKVKVGDEVILIGEEVTAKMTARHIRESVHTTLTQINDNVPRIYIENGKEVKRIEK